MSESAEPVTPPQTTAKAVVLLALAGLFAYYNSLHGAFVFRIASGEVPVARGTATEADGSTRMEDANIE